jgi:hypothetical protein
MKTEERRPCNSRHVERDEELEISAGVFSCVVRAGDLTGLPVIGSDVEGKGVNTVIVGKPDVLQPSILGVGEGVPDHMVGSHNLIVASPLRSCGDRVAESAKWKVENGRTPPKPRAYLAIEEWGQPRRGGPMRR